MKNHAIDTQWIVSDVSHNQSVFVHSHRSTLSFNLSNTNVLLADIHPPLKLDPRVNLPTPLGMSSRLPLH
jgi:hypothetical protein